MKASGQLQSVWGTTVEVMPGLSSAEHIRTVKISTVANQSAALFPPMRKRCCAGCAGCKPTSGCITLEHYGVTSNSCSSLHSHKLHLRPTYTDLCSGSCWGGCCSRCRTRQLCHSWRQGRNLHLQHGDHSS